jgi:hypothetical protein
LGLFLLNPSVVYQTALGQKGFGDLDAMSRLSEGHFLRKIDSQIDWRLFEELMEPLYHPTQGRPGHPPLVMFKALLLQQ